MLIGTRHIINDKITAEPLRANFVISGEPIEQKRQPWHLRVHIDSGYSYDQINQKFIPKHTLKMLY